MAGVFLFIDQRPYHSDMAVHVAILKPTYIRQILSGVKTVESRMTKTEQAPFGRIAPGERLFFKESGGVFRAMAIVNEVESFVDPTPEAYKKLEQQWRPCVGGDDAYWKLKRESRFLTFVQLREVEPIDVGPVYPKSAWKAWHVLDDVANPVRDHVLTEGAIRNRYLVIAKASDHFRQKSFHMLMPDGQFVETKLVGGTRVQWRGWGPYFQQYGCRPGDCVRLVCVEPQRYRVHFIRKPVVKESKVQP